MKIKNEVTKDWQGDPCLSINCTWDGLRCSSDNPPRIIALNLSSSGLAGEIFPSLSNLRSLESLDLSHNNLIGQLTEFLGQLPSLSSLNLSGNSLTGSIPRALEEKAKNGSFLLSVDGNPNLCLIDSCNQKKKIELVPIIVPIISILVLLLLAVPAIFWILKRKRRGETVVVESSKEGSVKSMFTYSEIVGITNNFERIIGRGGSGTVYHGWLRDGTQLAVKILSPSSTQINEFHTEVQLLMRIHHKNLASFVGYCNDPANMALVYEYMVNGDLKQHLSEKTPNVLSWKERLQIAVDAAQGLEYLHNGCKPLIVHRDMKTANILLNEKLQAKIADFGISRIFATETATHVSTRVVGTHGYLDPEYYATYKLNEKSDVYSFGIVLLELVTGQPAIIRDTDLIHITTWVNSMLVKGDIQSIVDPRLHGNFNINSAWKVLEAAMACVPPTAVQRLSMSNELVELKECLAMVMAHERREIEGHGTGTFHSLELAPLDNEFKMYP